ncbi:hypothetical protein [Nonomuraea sp. NPDC050786]|uniref:hypothetical protein n=1 Tax=Nonomuraea sp. NPDC050786 TaxID=3154840 RepID=UPI0033EA181C
MPEFAFKTPYADRVAVGDDVLQALNTLVLRHSEHFFLGDVAGYRILETEVIDHTEDRYRTGVTDKYPLEVRVKHIGVRHEDFPDVPESEPRWSTFWARQSGS